MSGPRFARRLYRILLALHPGEFGRSYGDEMLRIFDESVRSYGAIWLIGELARSLVLQRLLRPAEEDSVPAARLGLLAGNYPRDWPPHLRLDRLCLALLLSSASLLLFPRGEAVRRSAAAVRTGHFAEAAHGATAKR